MLKKCCSAIVSAAQKVINFERKTKKKLPPIKLCKNHLEKESKKLEIESRKKNLGLKGILEILKHDGCVDTDHEKQLHLHQLAKREVQMEQKGKKPHERLEGQKLYDEIERRGRAPEYHRIEYQHLPDKTEIFHHLNKEDRVVVAEFDKDKKANNFSNAGIVLEGHKKDELKISFEEEGVMKERILGENEPLGSKFVLFPKKTPAATSSTTQEEKKGQSKKQKGRGRGRK